jgi:hypothetical protein
VDGFIISSVVLPTAPVPELVESPEEFISQKEEEIMALLVFAPTKLPF